MKKDEVKKVHSKTLQQQPAKKETVQSLKKETAEAKKKDEVVQPMTKLPVALNNSSPDVSSSSDLNISEKERKRREKELKRLQENIVKNDSPLPSRRVIKRNSRYVDSTNNTVESEEEVTSSPAVRRRSETEKSVEKKSLPAKITKPAINTPSPSPVRLTRTTADSIPTPKVSTEFTTSTPKLMKPSTSLERVLPMKRRSDVSIDKLSEEPRVPPLKISTLARQAAEKSVEIKRVLPVRSVKSSESVLSAKESSSKVQAEVPEPFKLKKIVLKSASEEKLSKKSEDKNELKNIDEEPMDVDIPEVETKQDKLNRKDIENMGYVAVRSGFIFQCLAEKCLFNTMKKFAFINHLEEHHVGVNWSGHCKSCSSEVITNDKSKEGEFWHMMEKHVHEEKTNPDELPDIIEIPKGIEKDAEIVSEDTNDSALTAVADEDTVMSEDNSHAVNSKVVKVKSFAALDVSKPKIHMEKPLESEAPKRITVKSFANLSKFSPQAVNSQTVNPVRPMIQPKACDIPKKNVESDKLIARPKAFEVPKKDIRGETSNAGKSQIHDLRALMQKQTEENLRKLQSAAKSAQILPGVKDQPLKTSQAIPSTSQRPKEQQASVHNAQIKPSMPQQPLEKSRPNDQTPEAPSPKLVKFFIRKPVSGNSEIQVEDNKTPNNGKILRPWINKPAKKHLNQAVKLLETPALVATFKCMGLKCEFFTDSKEEFEKHLYVHLRTNPGDIASYIVCPYCDHEFTKYSIHDLTQHITDEHAYEKYQCKFCFYRSCSNFNVVEHQKIHHRMQQHNIIKLDNTKQRDYKAEEEKIKETCGKFIKPLLCASEFKDINFFLDNLFLIFSACKLNNDEVKKFFVLKHYINHLKNHERNKEIIKANCKKCNKQVDSAESLYSHIFECFDNIALYQCVYCLFGTNSDEKMYEHISNFHPSKVSLMCTRTDDQPMKEGVS